MNTILVELWGSFKVSARNIKRDRFEKTKLLPLSSTNFFINIQACVSSAQVSSLSKYKYINAISHRNAVPIKVQEIRTDYPMVVLREKRVKQSSINIVFQFA